MTLVTPAAWLPVTCDGVQYYTPIWHGTSSLCRCQDKRRQRLGEVGRRAVGSVRWAGSHDRYRRHRYAKQLALAYLCRRWRGILDQHHEDRRPVCTAFSAAQGAWTNIRRPAGCTICRQRASYGKWHVYQLSTSVTGSPVVANGTISLSNNNGVQQPTYNGATPLVLVGDGTSTINGVGASNWFLPTTASIGNSYYVSVTQTGGAGSFTGLSGVTNITNGGLTIGVTGPGGTTFSATGTYNISSDALGANVLGTGTITLTGGSLVQSPNWSAARRR